MLASAGKEENGPRNGKYHSNMAQINSVQTRCIAKGEAQKSPLFLAIFWGVFDFLRLACSLGIPQENL